MTKLAISAFIALVALTMYGSDASADIGEIEVSNCFLGLNGGDKQLNLSSVEAAQTFLLDNSETISAIKLPLQRSDVVSGNFRIRITDTVVNSAAFLVPDTSGTHYDVIYAGNIFPVEFNDFRDQSVSCDKVTSSASGTVVELTSPLTLPGGTYAILIEVQSGSDLQWAVPVGSDTYGDGDFYENNNSDDEGIPDDWSQYGGSSTDSAFVIFNSVIEYQNPITTPEDELEDWVDWLGFQTDGDNYIFGFLVLAALGYVLIKMDTHKWIIIAVEAIAASVLATQDYIPPWLVLAAFVVVGILFLLWWADRGTANE